MKMASKRIEELLSRPLRKYEEAEVEEPVKESPPKVIEKPIEVDDDSLPPQPELPAIRDPLSQNNRAKLERAKVHIEKLFLLAESGLIEGVHFYGRMGLEVVWIDGQAQELVPSISARDRAGA